MGAAEVSEFLSWLATERDVAAATQNQALHAILFLYTQVLGHESVETTMIYTHVMQKGAMGVASPLDRLPGKNAGAR
jgi:hypothetical protein